MDLRKLAAHYKIAIVSVIHTRKGVNIYQSMVDAEDVRGNATGVNTASYNLVITTYFKTQPPRAFVQIDKARYHPDANKKIYELKYDTKLNLYTQDRLSDFVEFEAIARSCRLASQKKEVSLNAEVRWR